MDELRRAFRAATYSAIEREGTIGQLGRHDGTLHYTDALGNSPRNRVWVTLADTTEVVARCVGIPHLYGLAVKVASRNGRYEVIGAYAPQADVYAGNAPLGVGPHAPSHGRTGWDPLYVEGQQVLPLMATPTTPASMAVTVYRGHYRYEGAEALFDTADSADLSAYIPGDNTVQHFVVLCLDRATNALAVVDGDDVAGAGSSAYGSVTIYDNPITTAHLAAVSIPAAYYPVCAIRFHYGQTSIGPYDIIADLRLWGGEHLGAGGIARPLALDASTQLTIAAGAITATTDYHTVAAETGTTDTLTTITAAADRQLLMLMAAAGHTITVDSGADNIALNGGSDVALSGSVGLLLFWDGAAWTDVAAGGASSLDGLSDVEISGAAQGDILRRDGTGFANENIAEDRIVLRLTGEDVKGGTTTEARTLLNVEDGADVTDATNVAAAGAVMDSDVSEAEGLLRKTGAGTYEAIKTNLGASTDPTTGDDSGDGYAVGSRWINTTTDAEFVCLDASVGSAVWEETTAAGGGADADAIHDNVAGEIAAVTEKATPVSADVVLIEDSEDGNAKKRVQVGNLPGGGGTTPDYIHVRDQRAVNTDGGTFTAGSYTTRVLNTEVSDAGGHCSLASNQMTLDAGTYRARISAPAIAVGQHKTRLYDTTGTATLLAGTSEYSPAGTNVQTVSMIMGEFTIAVESVVEVQHQGTVTKSTNGYGVKSNMTEVEVYTIVELWKIS